MLSDNGDVLSHHIRLIIIKHNDVLYDIAFQESAYYQTAP